MKKGKKFNILSVIGISLFIIMLIVTTTTLAVFYDQQTADSGNIKLGQIKLTTGASTVTINGKVFPGQDITNGNITCGKDANSGDLYVRAKITISTTEVDSVKTYLEETLMPAIFNSNDVYAPTSGYKWVENGGWYYLCKYTGTQEPLNVTDSATSYIFVNKMLEVPLTLEPMANNAQYEAEFKVQIIFEAVQSANIIMSQTPVISDLTTAFADIAD